MIYGQFRDRFPRVPLDLPGRSGSVLVEFIMDTGFDGAITLPGSLSDKKL